LDIYSYLDVLTNRVLDFFIESLRDTESFDLPHAKTCQIDFMDISPF